MSKILCVGDLHLSHTRLALCSSVLKWIASTIVEHEPDAVVYLGDVFDTHAVIRSECLGIWTNHLRNTLDYCATYWIAGNHEFFKPNDSTYNALIPFAAWQHKHLKIVTQTVKLDGLGFVPYLPHGQSWKEATSGFRSDVTFTHNTFLGADLGSRLAEQGIAGEEVSGDLIVSGHIHKRQQLSMGRGSSPTTVLYPGTPYSWSANDVDMTKGLTILDSDTLQTEFIESPFPTWRKVEVDLSVATEISIPDRVSAKDHLLLHLTGSRATIKPIVGGRLVEDLRSKYASVSVSTKFIDSAKSNASVSSVSTSSISETVESFMSRVYKGSAQAEDVKRVVLNALGEKR